MTNTYFKNFIKNWILPAGFIDLYQQIINHLNFQSKYKMKKAEASKLLSRNAKFNGMYKGRRCFVIGNGPSLKKVNLKPLKNEITIVMNLFFPDPILSEWQPTIYCAAEPPTGGWKRKQLIPIMKEGIAKLSPHAFFIPLITKNISDQYSVHPQDKTYYLRMEGIATEDAALDLTKVIPGAPDTSVMAIMLAVALGCNPIYLLGLDYDWLSHRSFKQHCYDESEDPIAIRQNLGSVPYLSELESTIRCWYAHKALKEIADHRGQKILNATADSFLDVYPLAQYEKIV